MTTRAQDVFIEVLALKYGGARAIPLEDGEAVPHIVTGMRGDVEMGERWFVYPNGVQRHATLGEYIRATEYVQDAARG